MAGFLDILIRSITALGLILGGLWALTKYVIERGLVPAAELDLDCHVVGEKEGHRIIEITLHILNRGSSILVAKNICLKLKTICTDDQLSLYEDAKKLGRLRFPHSLSESIAQQGDGEAFTLVPHDTFVQPGVDQRYPFVTTIAQDVMFLWAHGEFQYAQKPTRIQSGVLWVGRRMGLMQYSLQHIYKPHTAQRVFNVATSSYTPQAENSGDARTSRG